MTVREFISRIYCIEKHRFYLNDKLIDLAKLYNTYATIKGIKIDNNVIRLYIKDDDE